MIMKRHFSQSYALCHMIVQPALDDERTTTHTQQIFVTILDTQSYTIGDLYCFKCTFV